MTPTPLVTPEVQSLIEAICDGMADDSQVCKLESLLLSDVEARNFYVDFLDFDAKLQRLIGSLQEGEASLKEFISTQQAPPRQLAPSFLSAAYHGTIGFFSQELPFSLLIGTVLTGLGLWFASMVYVSSPDKIARDSSSLPSKTTFDPTLKVVGRITGMVDCKWADPNTETFNGANVLLGRKYVLASGLMEITYNTGAKVILQGPVTYEAESNGGYLSVGKLTGKLEKKVASGQWPVTTSSNPQSLIPNPFVIHTPTATVTDLGTEFGVEVQPNRRQDVVVFQGQVRVSLVADVKTQQNRSVLLAQGQSFCIEPDKKLLPRPNFNLAASHAFVRQFPQPTANLPTVQNPSFEEKGFNDDAPPKFWRYWAVNGNGRAPRVSSDFGGLAATAVGDHVLQIICETDSTIEAWQTVDSHFIPGRRYRLSVAVGIRNDLNRDTNRHLAAAEADWKISLHHAYTGKEVASLGGMIPNDAAHTGFLRDQTLTYTATSADAGHGIEMRLAGSTVGKKPSQPNGATMICMTFDNVRLNVTTASDLQPSDQQLKTGASKQPSGPEGFDAIGKVKVLQ